MRLLFQKPYKSIRSLDPIDLPDLTVLTGVNGAGKSHLLEAIEIGAVIIEGVAPNQPHGSRLIRKFDATTLVTQDTGAFSGAQISTELAGYWENIKSHWAQHSENFYNNLRQFPFKDVGKMTPRELIGLDEHKLLALGFAPDIVSQALTAIAHQAEHAESQVSALFVQQDPANRSILMRHVNAVKKLPIFAMTQDDFYEIYPENWQQVDLFQQSFARMFSSYQRAWRANELRMRGHESGAAVEALTKEQFLAKHGTPPWHFLNNILEIANIDFRINEPFRWDDRPYEPVLSDSTRGIQVKFNDLSSGERVLMSFALCLYHVNDIRASIEYPKVLLFDEIDAPLHPSMTSSLLRTIWQALVKERGIKVILTTHSPSTVALSPEDTIHVMRKTGLNRIERTSKDAALAILTSGVPTLSVNFENRRQIFVESKYDVEYYSAIFELAKEKFDPEISVTFIAAGAGGEHGNCDQVIKIAKLLRTAGNKTVAGLIDWDLKNKTDEFVFVLGEGDRYAIENYILDPLLVGLLLLRERKVDPKPFGVVEGYSYAVLLNSSPAAMQAIADHIIDKLISVVDTKDQAENSLCAFKYLEGFSLNVPRWLALLHGHSLEKALKEAFPSLQKYQGESKLKSEIISKVLTDRPGLIPFPILDALAQVQQVK